MDDIHFPITQGTLLWSPINFLAYQEKLTYPPSFFALAFHNALDDHNADKHVHTGNDPSTLDRNLVGIGPVTSEVMRLDCVIFAVSWQKG